MAPTVSFSIEGQGQYSTLGIYLLINSQRAVVLARVNGLDDQEPVSQLLHSSVRGVGLYEEIILELSKVSKFP